MSVIERYRIVTPDGAIYTKFIHFPTEENRIRFMGGIAFVKHKRDKLHALYNASFSRSEGLPAEGYTVTHVQYIRLLFSWLTTTLLFANSWTFDRIPSDVRFYIQEAEVSLRRPVSFFGADTGSSVSTLEYVDRPASDRPQPSQVP